MRSLLVSFLLVLLPFAAHGGTWSSTVTGNEIPLTILEPVNSTARPPVIFYLENLAAPRIGTESDAAIIGDFRAAGYLVVTLDYAHHPRARWPWINQDFVALRGQLEHQELLRSATLDLKHAYLVPAGCRLKRDVIFYRDEQHTFAMDIVYPSQPNRPVGAVLEFSCDNENRMANGSLAFCTDTLLAGATVEGFAAAMADHPVAGAYHGLDPLPACAWKTKAAVRTLRAQTAALRLNGAIISIGFSRASGMALLLATTMGHNEFEGHGEHLTIDSSVQGAIVLSGRFSYLDLLPNERMIPRYTATWGDRSSHESQWRSQGALDYLTAPTAPLFLSINRGESPEALHQMEVLRRRLTELSSPFEFREEPGSRGHHVPLHPTVLEPMLAYLHRQLDQTPSLATAP